ncbi:hypothetical protein NKH77_31480 [Streptomyces sp. M19]
MLLQPPGSTARTPARDWDGGHLWLRYRGPGQLYALSFRRRDGQVVLKRKRPVPGRPDDEAGGYTTLARRAHGLPYGLWHRVSATARTTGAGTVRLRLALNGRVVLDAEDRDPGRWPGPAGSVCAPTTRPWPSTASPPRNCPANRTGCATDGYASPRCVPGRTRGATVEARAFGEVETRASREVDARAFGEGAGMTQRGRARRAAAVPCGS